MYRNNTDISQIFSDIRKKDMNTVFIVDEITGIQHTYLDFYNDIMIIADNIKKKNLPKTIFLVLPNSYELVTLYFACLLSDRRASPIDPTKNKQEILQIVSEISESFTLVLNSNEWKGSYKKIMDLSSLIPTEEGINRMEKKINPNTFFNKLLSVDFKSPFLISYTSGTSGKPKGVIHSAGNLFLCADEFKKKLLISSSNVFLHTMPMTYMAGILNTIILPYLSCSKIIITERFSTTSAMKFWKLVSEYKANTFWLSPTMLALLQKIDRGVDGLNYCKSEKTNWYIGTAPLNDVLKKSFEDKYQVKLFQSYGLSETLFVSSVTEETHSLINPGVGTTLDSVKLTQRKDGELLIDVPWMFLGYTNEDTLKYFENGNYISGDVGDLSSGVLIITDRKKDLIIRGGINISPKAIENIARTNNSVVDISVFAGNDNLMGEIIICAVVVKDGVDTNEFKKNLLSSVHSFGSGYAIDKVVFLDSLPYNTNGKLDKNKLREYCVNQI